jgi:hypothetical protein
VGHANKALWAAAIIVALPILYVLSTGPVHWMAAKHYLNIDYAFAYYRPILYATSHSRAVKKAWLNYLEFWQELPPDVRPHDVGF